jgi:hypothetical protein
MCGFVAQQEVELACHSPQREAANEKIDLGQTVRRTAVERVPDKVVEPIDVQRPAHENMKDLGDVVSRVLDFVGESGSKVERSSLESGRGSEPSIHQGPHIPAQIPRVDAERVAGSFDIAVCENATHQDEADLFVGDCSVQREVCFLLVRRFILRQQFTFAPPREQFSGRAQQGLTLVEHVLDGV